MNRDHFLFLLIGALGGFLTGYLMHEAMSHRQPEPRFSRGTPVPGEVGAPTQSGQGTQSAQAAGTQAAMERVQRLRAYVEENPQDLDAVRQLANMHYDIADWPRAAELYERVLQQRPEDVDVMTDLGACYRNLQRPDDALGLFQRVGELAPDHWQSRYNQVLVLAFDLRDLERARAVLEELRAMQPNNPDVQRLEGEVARLGNA